MRLARHIRHGEDAAGCRTSPTCRLALRPSGCRPLLSCLPPLPVAYAPGVGGLSRLCCSRRGRRRTSQRPLAAYAQGKTAARRLAAPIAIRSAMRTRPCSHDDTKAGASPAHDLRRQGIASRHASLFRPQPKRMRNTEHGGGINGSEIATIERRRVGRTQQKQLTGSKPPASRPSLQAPTHPVCMQRYSHGSVVDVHGAVSDAHVLSCHCGHALEQRDVYRQVAALRCKRGGGVREANQHDAANRPRVSLPSCWIDSIPANRHAVRSVVDEPGIGAHEGRPRQCR